MCGGGRLPVGRLSLVGVGRGVYAVVALLASVLDG
jgi:hypothetical protein